MRVRFDDFVFDSEQRELSRAGVRVHISPKAVVLLEALLSERPKVIAKADLQARVWPDVVVEEANLTNLVSELRAALDDDPRQPRYVRTAHGFGYAFSGNALDEPETGSAKPARPHRLLTAGLTVTLAIAVLLFVFRMRRADAVVAVPSSPRHTTAERLTLDWLATAAISPDRRFVAYSTRGLARKTIRLRHLDSGAEFDLIPPDDAQNLGHLRFSPDGNWVYYLRALGPGVYDELRRTPVLGGQPEVIVQQPRGLGVAYALSPDGRRIAFIRRPAKDTYSVVVAGVDGNDGREVASFRGPENLCCSMSWSPDGRKLLLPVVSYERQPRPRFNLAIIDTASGRVERILAYPANPVFFADWMPDGRGFVAVTEADNQLKYFSYPELRAASVEAPAAQYLGVRAVGSAALFAIAMRNGPALWTVDLEKPLAISQITTGEATNDGGDGVIWTAEDRIVYSAESPAARSAGLRICNADGSNARELTRARPGVYHSDPAVSPDGSWIIFTENTFSQEKLVSSRIFRVRSDGSLLAPLAAAAQTRVRAFFTGDGKSILFTLGDALMKMPAEGGEAVVVRRGDFRACKGMRIDARAKWMACWRGDNQAYVMSLDDGRIRWEKELFPPILRWSPRGDLSYVHGPPANIVVQRIDGGAPKQITNFGAGLIQNFDWSPRDQKIVIARQATVMEAYLLRNVPFPDQSR